jgi:hypothetical protein
MENDGPPGTLGDTSYIPGPGGRSCLMYSGDLPLFLKLHSGLDFVCVIVYVDGPGEDDRENGRIRLPRLNEGESERFITSYAPGPGTSFPRSGFKSSRGECRNP